MAGREAQATYEGDNVQIFDIHKTKDFGPEKLTRIKLFKTGQLWNEIACYEPGQFTIMHKHPLEEEFIYVIEGTANMNVEGEEIQFSAGSLARFPANVMHDVRNLQDERLVIMFVKSPQKIERKKAKKDG